MSRTNANNSEESSSSSTTMDVSGGGGDKQGQQQQQEEEEAAAAVEFVSPLVRDASFATARTESDGDEEDRGALLEEEAAEEAEAVVVSPEAAPAAFEDAVEGEGDGETAGAAGAAAGEGEEAEAVEANKAQEEEEEEEEAVEPVHVGEEVDTAWGVGKVVAIRPPPVAPGEGAEGRGPPCGVYVVEAVQWRMAGGQAPTLYLQVCLRM